MTYGGYQYETSPRKLQPEEKTRKKVAKRQSKKSLNQIQKEKKQEQKRSVKLEIKLILYIVLGFAILCVISYRNSLITESFNLKEDLKAQLAVVQKENEQLQVNIENSLNLATIEQAAKERLGMQKLNNSQKVYISLPKKDYIEPATEVVILDEETSIWSQILRYLKDLF